EGVELILDIDPHIPSVLVTDTRKLGKILRHIIINGIKYTKTGGVYVRVYCKKRDYGANLCIDVKDTGIGMTAEELTKVYDRFYQANSGRTRSSSGLGLGLAIVYGFVANLGGFVTMESTPGKGTYVHISIPVRVESFIDCMSLERQKGMAVGIFTDMGRFPPAVREFYVAALRNFSQGLRLPVERADNVDSLKKIMSVTKLSHLFVSRPSYEQNKAFVDSLADSMTVAVIADEGYTLPDRLIFMQKPFYIYPAMNIINNRMINENGGRLMCSGVRALVVDDEPMNLTVAIGIMGRYGIEVTPAASGAESIELVKAQKFDIIFMDHMMPEMDGVTAMKRIRSVFPDPSFAPPVVALTANAVSSAREMFLSEGFDGFVSKPIDLKALEHVLRYLLPAGKVDIQSSSAEPSAVQEEDEEKTAGKILHSHGIDINEGLRYAADDMDFYRKLLKEFADEYPKKTAKLNDFMSADNMPDYAIVVHALKSTAKMIGAGELSEMAKASELAAKADNKAFVKEHHPALADKYGDVINGIREAFGEHSTEDTETAPDDAPMEFMPDDAPMEFMPEEDV
ncbi:MAG: response regulator, partial [Oscillospiraceae bacterium]|nr:response regulator [Oscillospiraceae bacterium]